ncbi:hypothetical protein C5167_020010 [Papaver somniferum]|uniref:Uncharacterized protein n=1 Tax=Papaver somniferum TaxID=3469 RepID=A0A4Y7IRU3_PAPSO|nr:hypothetical protein C5167_020010 [Papaver somniferum]
MLLDVCATIKDVLSMMKQSAQDLQSSIRRRSNEFDTYMISRKKICKVIQKCLSDLKKNTIKKNDVVANILAEVEAITLAVPDQEPIEEQLSKLRSSDLTSSISNNLVALKDFYECVEDFLSTEDAKYIDAVLDRSVMLLDVCATIKDVLSMMKQSSQDLQSSIRRQSNEFDAYMISRKKVCKIIQKCLSDLKKNTNKNNDVVADILTEVEAITLAVFESVLSFLSAPKQRSLVSKLTTKSATQQVVNEVTKVDVTLKSKVIEAKEKQRSLVSKLTSKIAIQQVVNEVTKVDVALKSKVIEAQEVQMPLAALEMSLQDLEDGLESMASSNKTFHARSISLPTTSYPLTLVVEEQLCRLRSSELATSSSSISNNLAGLKDLYESVEDLLSNHDVKCLDTVLDGSITLLDVCSTIKDVLSQMKQSVQDLQSSTRKCSIEIDTYMTSRKKVTKVIRKCLTDLKRTANKKNDLVADVSLLKKVEATTLEVSESILSFVSEPKQNRYLISKLMSAKGEAQQISEVMKIDIALKSKEVEVKDVQKPLKAVEMNLQDIEDGLESVFRCLIKNRVSLLNILNQ